MSAGRPGAVTGRCVRRGDEVALGITRDRETRGSPGQAVPCRIHAPCPLFVLVLLPTIRLTLTLCAR